MGERDRWSFSTSLVLTIIFGAAAMLFSLSLYARFHSHILHGHSFWFAPGDIWMSVDTGRYVWDGSLNHLYRIDPGFSALPLSSIVMAPVAEFITRHNLIESVVIVPKPSAWLLVGPYTLAFNVFVLDAARRLAWDLGTQRRLWAVQLITALTVLVPCFEWSHFEDALALTFVLHAYRYMLRQDFVRAGLLVSIAICWKQWAVVVIPLLVFAAPKGSRLRTAIASCALPGLLVSFFFMTEFHEAFQALFSPDVTTSRSGYRGLLALWFGVHSARVGRIGVVAAAVVIGWWFRKTTRPAVVLAAIGLALILRPLTEPVSWSYYWAPALCVATLTGIANHRSIRVRDWMCPVAALLWSLPHPGRPPLGWWWAVEIALLVLTAVQVVRNCREPRRDTIDLTDEPAAALAETEGQRSRATTEPNAAHG